MKTQLKTKEKTLNEPNELGELTKSNPSLIKSYIQHTVFNWTFEWVERFQLTLWFEILIYKNTNIHISCAGLDRYSNSNVLVCVLCHSVSRSDQIRSDSIMNVIGWPIVEHLYFCRVSKHYLIENRSQYQCVTFNFFLCFFFWFSICGVINFETLFNVLYSCVCFFFSRCSIHWFVKEVIVKSSYFLAALRMTLSWCLYIGIGCSLFFLVCRKHFETQLYSHWN